MNSFYRVQYWKMIVTKIAINPDRFDKLITSLRTAVDNNGVLDKEATSHNDIFDAFRKSELRSGIGSRTTTIEEHKAEQ